MPGLTTFETRRDWRPKGTSVHTERGWPKGSGSHPHHRRRPALPISTGLAHRTNRLRRFRQYLHHRPPEEIFGPDLTVISANDEPKTFATANDSICGLNSSVFTQDVNRARAAAATPPPRHRGPKRLPYRLRAPRRSGGGETRRSAIRRPRKQRLPGRPTDSCASFLRGWRILFRATVRCRPR